MSIMIPRVKPAYRNTDNSDYSVFSFCPVSKNLCARILKLQRSQKTSNFRHFRLCSKHRQTHNVGGIKQITCLMPQGMLSIDVPIIVFHIAKL